MALVNSEVGFIEYLKFNSVQEFMGANVHNINQNIWERGLKYHEGLGEQEMNYWYGAKSLSEVEEVCKGDWMGGLEKYQKLKNSLPEIGIVGDLHKKYKKRKRYSDSGDEIDVDKYVCGEHDDMYIDYYKKIEDKMGKIVTIYTSMGFSCKRSSTESLWMGITSVVLTDIFESIGYRVNLIGFTSLYKLFSDSFLPDKVQVDVNVKSPEKPLDLSSVLIAAAYPGFFRYFGFKVLNSFPYIVNESLGKAKDIPYIKDKNSFVISDIWDGLTAYNKICDIINQIKDRQCGIIY